MGRKKLVDISSCFWVIEVWKVASSGTSKSQFWWLEFSSYFVLYGLKYAVLPFAMFSHLIVEYVMPLWERPSLDVLTGEPDVDSGLHEWTEGHRLTHRPVNLTVVHHLVVHSTQVSSLTQFCWLFTIKDRCQKCCFLQTHNQVLQPMFINNDLGPLRPASHTWRCLCISEVPEATYEGRSRALEGCWCRSTSWKFI